MNDTVANDIEKCDGGCYVMLWIPWILVGILMLYCCIIVCCMIFSKAKDESKNSENPI